MLTLKFTVTQVMRSARSLWRIRIPARFSASGADCDVYYRSKEEAQHDQVRLRAQLQDGALVGKDVLSAKEVRDAYDALLLLREAGSALSLREALQEALQGRAALLKGISVAELLRRYAEDASAARGWSVKYRSTWRQYSSKFAEAFGGRNVASVQAPELRGWYAANYASAIHYNSALAVMAPAWSWAVRHELLERSPFTLIERRKVSAVDGVDVFSVEEVRRLLGVCRSVAPDALVAFAVLLFAGIRPDELTKLSWDDVLSDAAGTFIRVRAGVAKTRQVRNVRVRPTLQAFLDTVPVEGRVGALVPPGWKRKTGAVRDAARLKNRPDAARHSFASYALAAGESLDAVRADLGHARGSDMLFRHYRAAVSPAAAAEFWAIAPEQQ